MDLTSTERLNTSRNRRKASTISNSILHEFSSVIITETAQDEHEKEEKFTFKEALPQIGASISATSFHIIVGVTFAATATLLPQVVRNEEEPNDIMATNTQAAWIASMFVVSVPFASLFSGYIMDKIGRLNTVKISIIPAVASCVAIAMAPNVYVIILGRCLMGIATAFGVNPAVVYITETTSSDYRGPLVSAGPTLSSLGMMLGYLLGALLDWRTVSYINIAFCVIPLILIILFRVPESPAWLLLKGREDAARNTLVWISRWKTISSKEKFIDERLTALKKETKQKGVGEQLTFWERLQNLKKPTGYRPLIIFLIFFTFQQYCGVYISTVYAVQFFKGAGSSMNPFYASVLIGLIRFLGSLLTTVLLKHCKRRSMCLISCAGMAINMAISGYYTNQVAGSDEGSMVPVYCILIYVGFSMIGLLSLPWTMAAEVFPNEIRAIGHGLVVGGGHLVMFLSIQTFFDMVDFFGGYARLQWFFAIMSVLAMIFIYFCLPETHNRELADITEYFENNAFYPGRKKRSKRSPPPKISVTSTKEIKPKVQGLEALTEYDTLIHREEEQHPSILPKSMYVGNTDTSKLEFIDKSMELLNGGGVDEGSSEIAHSRSAVSLPEVKKEEK